MRRSGHPSIIGNGSDTIPKLVEIITKALVAEIMDEELTTKMVTVLRSILGSASVELRGQLWAGLSPKIQTFLTTKNFV